eukprot:7162480-Prymnesium_polylepis.1
MSAAGKKQDALTCIKRKKMYDKQRLTVSNQLQNLELQKCAPHPWVGEEHAYARAGEAAQGGLSWPGGRRRAWAGACALGGALA